MSKAENKKNQNKKLLTINSKRKECGFFKWKNVVNWNEKVWLLHMKERVFLKCKNVVSYNIDVWVKSLVHDFFFFLYLMCFSMHHGFIYSFVKALLNSTFPFLLCFSMHHRFISFAFKLSLLNF